jgi:hypothetical protein
VTTGLLHGGIGICRAVSVRVQFLLSGCSFAIASRKTRAISSNVVGGIRECTYSFQVKCHGCGPTSSSYVKRKRVENVARSDVRLTSAQACVAARASSRCSAVSTAARQQQFGITYCCPVQALSATSCKRTVHSSLASTPKLKHNAKFQYYRRD